MRTDEGGHKRDVLIEAGLQQSHSPGLGHAAISWHKEGQLPQEGIQDLKRTMGEAGHALPEQDPPHSSH